MTPKDLIGATPRKPVPVGRYDVTGVIGAGGMGAVFEACDREHGTRAALKTLTHLDARNLLRFKTEFRAVADLSHPNLVSLYELSCHDDLWFFTMERVDGGDLLTGLRGPTSDENDPGDLPTRTALTQGDDTTPGRLVPSRRVQASPPRSIPQLRDALAQLVRGVRALHAAGLLHLDLKPSNVLLDQQGRVVIVDFGLVRSTHPGTFSDPMPSADLRTTTISGTPRWMAPEQHTGQGVGEASDWYAVGLMLYQALTGLHAFPQADLKAMVEAKQNVPPIAPAELVAGVPDDLSALAMALIQASPGLRPGGDVLAFMTEAAEPDPAPFERSSRSTLVDRAVERELLGDALRLAHDRGAAVVHLVGPSGVGKTALLDSLLTTARGSGALALRGRCYERETVPYKAFEGLLDGLAGELASRGRGDVMDDLPPWIHELSRMFPVLSRVPVIGALLGDGPPTSSVSDIELRRRAVEALRELFASLASRRPLVLGIDDLQWADADSTALLSRLLEPPAPPGLLLAATFRPEEAAANVAIAPYLDAARQLARRSEVRLVSLDVGPLGRKDAEQLALTTLARRNASVEGISAAIAEEAAGNPFFIEELAHLAAQQREAGVDVTRANVALEHVLARRVQALSAEERALVEVLAVANSPIPLGVAFAVARIQTGGVLRALWSLRGGHFVRSTGVGLSDRIELHHDRMRESVLGSMEPSRVADHHLALGQALAELVEGSGAESPWLFDAVRHLNSVHERLADPARQRVARLDLLAGSRARAAAAFPLAFACFRAGTRLLGEGAWDTDYALALALHGSAAESAYLSASWGELDEHVAQVKARGRTVLDQLVAWEAQIDGHIARNEYASAVDTALEALRLLGVELPAHPGQAEVGSELKKAMDALASVTPETLLAMPMADDPMVAAAMRIQTRIGSATYFARPMLFPLLACRQVVSSVEHGLSAATPYALSVYGIVLNTLGLLHEAHAWGRVALSLIERIDDRSLEARTRHVVHDLVCTWTVPLASTLDDLRAVVEIGKLTGDLEYAAYAAHAYVHNAFYACRQIDGLLDEALDFGAFMRGYRQVNALHVHAPFEQALRCFAGRAHNPASLDGDGFDEADALRAAEASGSRSAQCIVRLLMGLVRYHFGSPAQASELLELARPFLDGVVSTWHVPMLHQYAALAIHALPPERRRALLPQADESLAALRALAAKAPDNFAHRVSLVSAESARTDGDLPAALDHLQRAIAVADAGGWHADLGLAHELAARCHDARSERPAAEAHRAAARDAYTRWGALAKVNALPSL